MNKQQTKQAIEVMQAWVDGKTLEYKDVNGTWKAFEPEDDAAWDWWECKYRIAPEPMEIEVWVDGKTGVFLSVLGDRDHQAFMERSGYTKKKFREVL